MSEEFIGSWNLLSFKMGSQKGWPSFYPLGREPKGMLIYSPEGTMSVQIAKRKRKLFSSKFALLGLGKKNEIYDTIQNYVCYCGFYDIDKETKTIRHKIMNNIIPNEEEKEYIRYYSIEGEKLKLTTTPISVGVFSLIGVLEWEKIEGSNGA